MEEVRKGYKMTDIGIIPKDWEVKEIGTLLNIGNGSDYKHLGKGEIPVYGTGGLITYVDDYLYDGETVCIGRKGTIDKPLYFNGKIWTVDTLFYTHSFINSLPKYIYYNFLTIDWKSYNEASGVPSLSKKIISKILIGIPKTIIEQTAIATALSDIDSLISALDKKIEKKKAIKQGIMQQLLTGKIRLPNFNKKWVKRNLGDLLVIKNGRDYKHLHYGNVPVYGTGGLMTFVDDFLYEGETVCIGRKGTIDKPYYFNGKIWTVDTLYYTCNFTNCIAKYIFYLFSTIDWISYNEATGVPSLSQSIIYSIEVMLPSTLAEQTAIVTFLSDCDKEISSLEAKRDKYKEMKQGMMQQLLTGIIRLI